MDAEANDSIFRTTEFDIIAVHCIALQPNSTIFKTASHLCCLLDYDSNSIFSLHKLQTQTLKKIFLRSEVEIKGQISEDQTKMFQMILI